jgi:drug/metabolite transporter (DMT)-like permease
VLGEALAVVSLLLFSANVFMVGAATRRLRQDLGFLLALVSNVVCAGVVVLAQYVLAESMPPFEWDALALFALGGLLTSYLGRWFFFRSVTAIGPTRASALQITNPVFAALAAWVVLGEALPPLALIFGSAVLAGLYMTSRPAGRPTAARLLPGHTPLPIAEVGLALLGAAAYGLGNVARGAGVRDWTAPVVGGLIGAAAGLTVHAIVGRQLRTLASAVRRADSVGRRLWILSGFLTIAAQTCLIAATQHIPVAIAVVISAAMPIVVLPISVFFLRRTESVGPATGVGALLVLAGVAGLVLS